MNRLELSNQTLFARGGRRAVYLDPRTAERLIKVLLPDAVQSKGGLARSFFVRFAPQLHRNYLLQQEYREYLRIILMNLDGGVHLPMSHLFGFVETDLGIGFVVERVRCKDMKPAPTWRSIASDGTVEQRDIDALSDFCRRMLMYGVRASDLTASNVVLGYREFEGKSGPYEAVLIDGYGDTHMVPVRTWSKAANRFALTKRFRRLGAMAGLIWESENQKFVTTPK